MAIAYGNSTSTSAKSTSASLAAPTVSGSDTILLLSCTINTGTSVTFSSVTYNSVSISANVVSSQLVNYTQTTVWFVKNPASAATFAVVFSGGTWNVVLTATYFTGVDQTTSYRTVATATGTTTAATVDVTSSQSNDLIFGVFGLNDTTIADGMTDARKGAGQTFISQTEETIDNATATSLCTEPGATGTVTHSWSFVENVNNGWTVVAIPLIPAAGGGGRNPVPMGFVLE